MEVEIRKIFKDKTVHPNFMEHGNIQVFFPEFKMLLIGIEFSITVDGKLSLKRPKKFFYFKDESGKQIKMSLPVVKFENDKEVWESVGKTLRKRLLADITSPQQEDKV